MDHSITLAHPLTMVFAHLASPLRLSDWLTDVQCVEELQDTCGETGATFELTLQVDGRLSPARAEIIAYEPPAAVSYRLFVGLCIHVVRVICTARSGWTCVEVHRNYAALTLDLDRLKQAVARLAATGETSEPEDGPTIRSA